MSKRRSFEINILVTSQRPVLSEADQAEMEGYTDELLSILPVLEIPFFESPQKSNFGQQNHL